MPNITVYDNGSAFLVRVNGLTVGAFNSLGAAWNHIAWMHVVESQKFTVGTKKEPVDKWLEKMIASGTLDKNAGYMYSR